MRILRPEELHMLYMRQRNRVNGLAFGLGLGCHNGQQYGLGLGGGLAASRSKSAPHMHMQQCSAVPISCKHHTTILRAPLSFAWGYSVSHNLWLAFYLHCTPSPGLQVLAQRLALNQTAWSRLGWGGGRVWECTFAAPRAGRRFGGGRATLVATRFFQDQHRMEYNFPPKPLAKPRAP